MVSQSPRASPLTGGAAIPQADDLAKRLLRQHRAALLLRPEVAADLDPELLDHVWRTFREGASLVPDGPVYIHPWPATADGAEMIQRRVQVDAFYLDRYAVTNEQFQCFVREGGYHQQSLWNPEGWRRVDELLDVSGVPGPRFWSDGRFPEGTSDHPVVGISWYEADAYARWAGKRLPTDAEWLKASCWPMVIPGQGVVQRKYPWGNTMDNSRANLWASGHGGTVPVDHYPRGQNVTGVYQLVGNVWEWMAGELWMSPEVLDLSEESAGTVDVRAGLQSVEGLPVRVEKHPEGGALCLDLKSLRGGAFDTYFESHAVCQAHTGDHPFVRRRNIGFRCAVRACDLSLDENVRPRDTDPRPGSREEGGS